MFRSPVFRLLAVLIVYLGVNAVVFAQAEPEAAPVVPALPGLVEFGDCKISGEVFDFATIDALKGVVVTIAGRPENVLTKADGSFLIDKLPEGTYLLNFSTLGYSTGEMSVTTTTKTAGEARIGLRIKTVTESDEVMLDEEPVIGEYAEASNGDFALDISSASTLSSGLSEEDFARQNLGDAGEAVEKISGANIVDGKFAVVRGLADRYITTTFNGAAISSSVPDRKAVQLDLFPTSALRGINVSKTYEASLSGDFGGAAIDILSKSFPDERVLSFKVKQEFNPSLPEKVSIFPDNNLGFFGELGEGVPVDSIRNVDGELLTSLPNAPGPLNSPENLAIAETRRQAASTLLTYRSFIPQIDDSEDKRSFSFAWGDSAEWTPNVKVGFLVAGGQENSDSFNESAQFRRPGRTWFQEDFARRREWNLYASTGIEIAERHKINAVYFNKHVAEQSVSVGRDIRDTQEDFSAPNIINNIANNYAAPGTYREGFYETDAYEQDLSVFQLSGDHEFSDRGVKFDWSFTRSNAVEDRPDYSFVEFGTIDYADTAAFDRIIQDIVDSTTTEIRNALGRPGLEFSSLNEAEQFLLNDGTFTPAQISSFINTQRALIPNFDPSLGQVDTLSRLPATGETGDGNRILLESQSTDETTFDNQASSKIPFYFSEDNEDSGFELSFGFNTTERTRKSRGLRYSIVGENASAGAQFPDTGIPNELVQDGESLLQNPAQLEQYIDRLIINDQSTRDGVLPVVLNVDAVQQLDSQFLGGHLFGKNYFIRAGARFESEERFATIISPRPDLAEDQGRVERPPVRRDSPAGDEILPSIIFGTTHFDGKWNIVGAYSETVARPSFLEWVPTNKIELTTGFLRIGNEDLLNSAIKNYDLAIEYKPSELSVLRLSFFRKDIKEPIIELLQPDETTITYDNGQEGLLQGVEFEFEYEGLGPFSIQGNATFIDAELLYDVDVVESGVSVTRSTAEKFPFQPEYIANFNIGYENEEWGLKTNLIYNYQSDYLTRVRRSSQTANLQQNAQHSLDLVARKTFGEDLQIGFGIKNLIASDRIITFTGEPLSEGRERSRQEAQRTYFIEAKYSF